MDFELVVSTEMEGLRLDQALTQYVPGVSRSRVQRVIRDGWVLVDGQAKNASYRLRVGEWVTGAVPERPPVITSPQPEETALDVIYEDDDLVVVNKPRSMVVHPAVGSETGTLVNALLARGHPLSTLGGPDRPGIFHRLDKDTSGLIVVAKTNPAHARLQEQWRGPDRQTLKEYAAIVCGAPPREEDRIEEEIARHPVHRRRMTVVPFGGRLGITNYRVIERFPGFAHLQLAIETGRTHQIRVHLAHLRCPVVGDPLYGGRRPALQWLRRQGDAELERVIDELPGQLLHARRVRFRHPSSGEQVEFVAPLPGDMEAVLAALRQRAAAAAG